MKVHLWRDANCNRVCVVYDSSTKVPDGLLTGNVVQLGNFDECLATHALDADGHGLFWGQYCLAGLAVERAWPPPNASAPANNFSNHLLAALAGHRLQWAVCLPASCAAEDLEAHLQARMPELLLADAEAPPFELRALLLATVFAIVMASTAYDVTHPDTNKDALWLAFSVRKNAAALFATRAHGQMASVNGIKFLSMAWVLLFHKYCVMVETPNDNSDVVLEGLKYDWTQMPISNGGTMAVNSFFVIGGLLLTHGFIRDRVAGRPFSLVSFYVYRYIRITPVYAVVVAVYATLLYHMGSGPLWNPVMAMHRENCRHHWWRNLLYINNYQPVTSELCVVQTWYLAADMQLYWLSPLLLWPLWRWPRVGRALLATLLVVPLASTFWITYARRYPWADAKDVSNEIRNSYFPLIHASAYARSAPFLVGVALAWALHLTRKNRLRLPAVVVALAWVSLGCISWTITYALYIYYKPDHAYSALEAASFQALHPLGWGLIVAWLIFACERGYAGPVAALLSWRWWQPLSRLTYTAYLVHFAVFYYDLGVTRSPGHYTHYNVVHIVLGDLVLILLLASAAALAFELPVLNIDRALLKPKQGASASAPAPAKAMQRLSVPAVALGAPRPSLRSNGSAPGAAHVNVAFEDDLPAPAPEHDQNNSFNFQLNYFSIEVFQLQ
ncbi:hypothetical protein R5R35_013486 [Gryllus longicercus]|uniref:Nose resistant-to-fluoxetine protein N-terminal domain-containing protein n=1 Tax=Gryllus longicercus TaxID=2509291 RepID=A0AAN9VFC9_9ORTH